MDIDPGGRIVASFSPDFIFLVTGVEENNYISHLQIRNTRFLM